MNVLRWVFGRGGGTAALVALALAGTYFFGWRHMRFFRVPSSSMDFTLLRGDYIVTLDAPAYRRGDIVVMRDPEDEGSYLVKRIAALGGDSVAVAGGALYVNGAYVSEPYTLGPPQYTLEPLTVPNEAVFVLGDNRNDSDDSHLWRNKTPPVSSVVGKVRFLYYPYPRFGAMHSDDPLTAIVIPAKAGIQGLKSTTLLKVTGFPPSRE